MRTSNAARLLAWEAGLSYQLHQSLAACVGTVCKRGSHTQQWDQHSIWILCCAQLAQTFNVWLASVRPPHARSWVSLAACSPAPLGVGCCIRAVDAWAVSGCATCCAPLPPRAAWQSGQVLRPASSAVIMACLQRRHRCHPAAGIALPDATQTCAGARETDVRSFEAIPALCLLACNPR